MSIIFEKAHIFFHKDMNENKNKQSKENYIWELYSRSNMSFPIGTGICLHFSVDPNRDEYVLKCQKTNCVIDINDFLLKLFKTF